MADLNNTEVAATKCLHKILGSLFFAVLCIIALKVNLLKGRSFNPGVIES